MVRPAQFAKRQEDLGPAGFFQPEAVSPPANQILVRAGFALAGAVGVIVQTANQLSAGFSVVSVGNQRYDLVYIDKTGTVGIQQGTQVAAGSPAFRGAPGWTGTTPGPLLLDNIVPVAWVFVNETASVTIVSSDITQVNGFIRPQRDLMGFFIDKGLVGSVPAGPSSVVTGSFASEVNGGSATQAGVITTAPSNIVNLVDQVGNQIEHGVAGTPIFGRITFSGGVWTLSYFYELAGVETVVANLSTDSTLGAGLTNVRMSFTPKVYSIHDSTRPLFASAALPLLGKIAGEIPFATTSVGGIVLAATGSPAQPLAGAVNEALSSGSPVAGGPFYRISFPAGGVTGAAGVLTINSTGSPGPPGPPGPSGPTGSPGPPGPGFSSEGPSATTTVAASPTRSGSNAFGFGFQVKFYMANMSNDTPSSAYDAIWITAVSKSGTQVTVNWQTDDGGTSDGISAVLCVSAAG